MEFRLLGPLDVVEHGGSLALGGVKQRSLLAVLLLNANQLSSDFQGAVVDRVVKVPASLVD